MTWAEERAVERSAAVQKSRDRIANQVRGMLDAARRLVDVKGDAFTTQELAKEAGVALQTFYRHFASKDELLLAIIADELSDACSRWEEASRELPDPLTRLRFYFTNVVGGLGGGPLDNAMARFIVSTHWRLHRVLPSELREAEQPVVDLLLTEINAAADEGLLHPANPEADAWFVAELLRSVFHHYTFASGGEDVEERLWQFCLRALGGVRA